MGRSYWQKKGRKQFHIGAVERFAIFRVSFADSKAR